MEIAHSGEDEPPNFLAGFKRMQIRGVFNFG
jgi:hypothetical protein